jgi:hypothetical protein
MSTLTADPGFRRGTVLGVTWKAYDAEPADGSNLVGGRKTFRDENPTTGVVLSNHTVDCIAVRNTSGAALLPGQVVELDATLTQASLLSVTQSKSTTGTLSVSPTASSTPSKSMTQSQTPSFSATGSATPSQSSRRSSS